ncbi:MAG TPA: hypothetical protein VFP54_00460 [Acidimicrobiales bacterium]|nr:hypothetical protein [Acidimicrobiales bacterium]
MSSAPPILPFYWPSGFEEPIVLYDGPAALHQGDKTYVGVGQVVFQWRRSPRVRWSFASNDTKVPDFLDGDPSSDVRRFEMRDNTAGFEARMDVVPWSRGLQDGYSYVTEGFQPHDTPVGIGDGFAYVLVHIVNYIDQVHTHAPTVDTEAGGWRITVVRCEHTAEVLQALEESGGYGFTHVARLSRSDGSTFGFNDAALAITGLWRLLSFGAAGTVGTALPVGFDAQGRALGVLHHATVADYYRGHFSWVDSLHVQEVGRLFEGWFRLQDDPFWGPAINRAMRSCVTAHRADPLDESIVTILSCLELLAWSVLQIEERWLEPGDGELTLAGRLRLLLRWIGQDQTIPPQLKGLVGLAKAETNVIDGPTALTWVRNRLVHPPKLPKTSVPGWPEFDQQHEVWRLALEYAHLVILRLLGFTGEHGSLLHMDGRWTGTMTPVPWKEPYTRPSRPTRRQPKR